VKLDLFILSPHCRHSLAIFFLKLATKSNKLYKMIYQCRVAEHLSRSLVRLLTVSEAERRKYPTDKCCMWHLKTG